MVQHLPRTSNLAATYSELSDRGAADARNLPGPAKPDQPLTAPAPISDDAGRGRLLAYYENKARALQERAERLRATTTEVGDENKKKALMKEIGRLEKQAGLHRENARGLG